MSDFGDLEMYTATVESGASAVLVLPYVEPAIGAWLEGACDQGSVVVLAPVFWIYTDTSRTPPHAARGPASPVIDRSGSENPSWENARSARVSSGSTAVRSVRRPARRCLRVCRDSLANTEHLPVAE